MPDTRENYRIIDKLINQCADKHSDCIGCELEDECVSLYESMNNALFKRSIVKRSIPDDIFNKFYPQFIIFLEIREALVMPGSISERLDVSNPDIAYQPIMPL